MLHLYRAEHVYCPKIPGLHVHLYRCTLLRVSLPLPSLNHHPPLFTGPFRYPKYSSFCFYAPSSHMRQDMRMYLSEPGLFHQLYQSQVPSVFPQIK